MKLSAAKGLVCVAVSAETRAAMRAHLAYCNTLLAQPTTKPVRRCWLWGLIRFTDETHDTELLERIDNTYGLFVFPGLLPGEKSCTMFNKTGDDLKDVLAMLALGDDVYLTPSQARVVRYFQHKEPDECAYYCVYLP